MTLIKFIKSKLSDEGEVGKLAKDIQYDLKFPGDKSEKEIMSYLNFHTQFQGANSAFRKLVKEFKDQTNTNNYLDLDAKYSLLRTENWKFYKEYFPVDKVFLVGEVTDFYKAYCIDSSSRKSLFFDIKSSTSLNDIRIVDEEEIYFENSTRQVSISDAINLLENCVYAPPSNKPNQANFKELIEFLNLNV